MTSDTDMRGDKEPQLKNWYLLLWPGGGTIGARVVEEDRIAELERIMDSGEGGLSQSLVKLQPIARLNAIMVISSKPALLKTAATWITRLDRSDTASVRAGCIRQLSARK